MMCFPELLDLLVRESLATVAIWGSTTGAEDEELHGEAWQQPWAHPGIRLGFSS